MPVATGRGFFHPFVAEVLDARDRGIQRAHRLVDFRRSSGTWSAPISVTIASGEARARNHFTRIRE
ncbi:MAG TPA: hypothetical protein VE869_05710 [Gemmatimonas sp.]|nr:hypothetical protein [Gemmatimonas sp.]